jgi:hypothetical protein
LSNDEEKCLALSDLSVVDFVYKVLKIRPAILYAGGEKRVLPLREDFDDHWA